MEKFGQLQQKRLREALTTENLNELIKTYKLNSACADLETLDEITREQAKVIAGLIEKIFGVILPNKITDEEKEVVVWDDIVRRGIAMNPDINYNNDGLRYFMEFDSLHQQDVHNKLLATVKIAKLIEVVYGGNVSDKENKDQSIDKYVILPRYSGGYSVSRMCYAPDRLIAFKTKEDAERFISYASNSQLLRDYFMIK